MIQRQMIAVMERGTLRSERKWNWIECVIPTIKSITSTLYLTLDGHVLPEPKTNFALFDYLPPIRTTK